MTVRSDTGTELGSVGPSYTVLQNRDAFRALEPLVDDCVVRLETGGQSETIASTKLFVAPSTSAAANRCWDIAMWRAIAELVT